MDHFVCDAFSKLDDELKDDLLEAYEEARQEIEDITNRIDDYGFSADKLDQLFRSLHSMKGNCAVCFLDPLVDVLHKLEEIVEGIRSKDIEYDPTLGDLINLVIEQVYYLLAQLYKTGSADSALCDILQSNLDQIYAERDARQQLVLSIALLDHFSEEASRSVATPISTDMDTTQSSFLAENDSIVDEPHLKATQAPPSIIERLELTQSEQQGLHIFQELSYKLNGLLAHRPERCECILELCLAINDECEKPINTAQLCAAAYMHNMGMALIMSSKDDEEQKKQIDINHPMIGARLLSRHSGWDVAVEIVETHKEKFDGAGIPKGLEGFSIPQGAFIVSMAVMFVDIVKDKTGEEYRKAAMQAVQKINFESGKSFSPFMIAPFNFAICKMLMKTTDD